MPYSPKLYKIHIVSGLIIAIMGLSLISFGFIFYPIFLTDPSVNFEFEKEVQISVPKINNATIVFDPEYINIFTNFLLNKGNYSILIVIEHEYGRIEHLNSMLLYLILNRSSDNMDNNITSSD